MRPSTVMGKRGPAPTPTRLRVLRGERVDSREPMPSEAPVEPPNYLDADALDVWRRLAPDLEAKGVLTAWDVDCFAVLCTAVVHHRRAVDLVNRSAPLIEGRRDEVIKHPGMQVIRDSAGIVRAYAQEFGLTPSARRDLPEPLRQAYSNVDRLLT